MLKLFLMSMVAAGSAACATHPRPEASGATEFRGVAGVSESRILRLLQAPSGTAEAFVSRGSSSPRRLELETVRIELELTPGRRRALWVDTAFEPTSGLFWWSSQFSSDVPDPNRLATFKQRQTFGMRRGELVGARILSPPPSFWIRRSTMRVGSSDEGRALVMAQLIRDRETLGTGDIRDGFRVPFFRTIPPNFYHQPVHASPLMEMRVERFEAVRGGWRLLLAGRNERKGEMVLDRQFERVSWVETDPGVPVDEPVWPIPLAAATAPERSKQRTPDRSSPWLVDGGQGGWR